MYIVNKIAEDFSTYRRVCLTSKHDEAITGHIRWSDGMVRFFLTKGDLVIEDRSIGSEPGTFEFQASLTDFLWLLGYVEEPWRDMDDLCLSEL